MIRHHRLTLLAGAALLAAACATPPVETAEARPDPRQGEEIRNVCLTTQVKHWRPHDERSVIIEAGRKDEYKLELTGACIPEDARVAIQFNPGGTDNLPCIESGVTQVMGSCVVSRIYKWEPNAASNAGSIGAARLAIPRGGIR